MDITPMHDRHDDRIEVEALLGQDVFVALGGFLVGDPAQHAEANQLLQPVRQYMAGNPERGLESFEPALAQETLPQNQEAPAIADHRDRAGKRAGLFFKRIPLHQRLQSLPPQAASRSKQRSSVHSNSVLTAVQPGVRKFFN
jgi:hypothetical protein